MTLKEDRVLLGEISGVHGLQGWVKVYSFTRPREQIFDYAKWYLLDEKRLVKPRHTDAVSVFSVEANKFQGKHLLAKLSDIDDRNQAENLVGYSIFVSADDLQALDEDEYYWRDLIGLNVVDQHGNSLGELSEMLETGANDVMLVSMRPEGKDKHRAQIHAIPWVDDVVKQVNLTTRQISVDWETEWDSDA